MLKLREVSAYAPIIHQVIGDLLRRVEVLRSLSQDQVTVSDLASELHKFGFEGGRVCSSARLSSGERVVTGLTPCRYLLHLV